MTDPTAAHGINFAAENEPGKYQLSLQNKWHRVVGKHVLVKLEDRVIRVGVAEEVTADNEILWIASHGTERRALFERALGFSVWAQ